MRKAGILLLLTLPLASMAATTPDSQLTQCLNKAGSTASISGCYDQAAKAWDKTLNSNYTSLMQRLSAPQQTALREAQRSWIAYRDSWIKAARVQAVEHGTSGTIEMGAALVALNKNQAEMVGNMLKSQCQPDGRCR